MTEPTGHQEGSQPPLLMLEVMDPYAAWKPLITSAAGADTSAISPSLTLALTVGMTDDLKLRTYYECNSEMYFYFFYALILGYFYFKIMAQRIFDMISHKNLTILKAI